MVLTHYIPPRCIDVISVWVRQFGGGGYEQVVYSTAVEARDVVDAYEPDHGAATLSTAMGIRNQPEYHRPARGVPLSTCLGSGINH